jgi:hypothetical protein
MVDNVHGLTPTSQWPWLMKLRRGPGQLAS